MTPFDVKYQAYGNFGANIGDVLSKLAMLQKQKALQDEAMGLYQQNYNPVGINVAQPTPMLSKDGLPTMNFPQTSLETQKGEMSFDYPKALQMSIANPFARQALQDNLTQQKTLSDIQEQQANAYAKTNPQEKFTGDFGNFLKAKGSQFKDLGEAWDTYQKEALGIYGKKEEIKSKYKAQKDGKAISSYVSEDGYKKTIWRNPDGTLVELQSKEKVKPNQESPSTQKESAKLSTLQELSNTIRQSIKPDYLGGVASGISGNGMGGLTGALREATGYISDDEAQFRANVQSLKNQLLYLRSGAQINENEYQRLLKELPDLNQPENVFTSRLDAFDKQLNDLLKPKGSSNTKSKPRFEIIEQK